MWIKTIISWQINRKKKHFFRVFLTTFKGSKGNELQISKLISQKYDDVLL